MVRLRAIICLLAVIGFTTIVNGESEDEYLTKYKEAIKAAKLSPTQNVSTWDVKPVGSDFDCYPFVHLVPAKTVHELTPYDIKVVGALGDSVTAAFGAKAMTIIDDLIEFRGVSWSVGGDGTLSTVTTLPNIIREYNHEVVGFSVKTGRQTSANSHFNRAVTGAIAQDMPAEAIDLVEKIRNSEKVDFFNDWKMVTMWIGGNNLCSYCKNKEKHSPENYINGIKDALDYLKDNLPRTFVNVVQIIDITKLENATGLWCGLVHSTVCKCKLDKETSLISGEYQRRVDELIGSGRYDDSDDFTVVIQPFMEGVEVPLKPDGKMDMSYFAPDCFHFSTKGHREGAVALWNNMIEPVGSKTKGWIPGGPIICPQEPYYFFTAKNSIGSNSVFNDNNDNTPSGNRPSHQLGSNTATIIAGSVVAVAVVAVVLMGLSMLAGFIVRRRSRQMNVTGETIRLVEN